MKRKRFEGIDKKIIDLIKTHGSLSIVELANYLQVSRTYAGKVVDGLVKSGSLTKSLILNSNSDKYYPNTFIISLSEKIDNTECTKGGKAKKAPYETTHARIPTEVKPLVENISNTYKVLKENNDIESIEKLLSTGINSSEYLTKESALTLFNQLIEVIEDQQKKIDATINAIHSVIDMTQSIASNLNYPNEANHLAKTRRTLKKNLNN